MIESWRVFFPTAALLAVLGLAAWGAQLAGVPLGLLPADHGAYMLLGVMGSGIFGFLLTAYARQNDAPLPGPRVLGGLWVLQVGAASALLLRPAWPTPVLTAVLAAPWVGLLAWAAPVAARSLRRKWDATTAAAPLALVAALAAAVQHATGLGPARAVDLAVFPFVTLLALAILDRVLPFFSARALPGFAGGRSPWFLGPLAVLLWARALVPEQAEWVSLAVMVWLGRQWWGWRPWPVVKVPMVGILHVGVAWFVLGFGLSAAGAPGTVATHALLVGGLGTLLLGISMRVVRGHSGLPVLLGRGGGVVFALAQLGALVRVLAGWTGGGSWMLVTSAVLFAGAFGVWLARFAWVCARLPPTPAPRTT